MAVQYYIGMVTGDTIPYGAENSAAAETFRNSSCPKVAVSLCRSFELLSVASVFFLGSAYLTGCLDIVPYGLRRIINDVAIFDCVSKAADPVSEGVILMDQFQCPIVF